MIFSNKGQTQVEGDPLQLSQDIANSIRTIRKHLNASGMPEKDINELLVYSGKLAMLDEKNFNQFIMLINSRRPKSMNEIMDMFDQFQPKE